MNKHITPQEVPHALIEEERKMLMWEHQSPTVPACNPHPEKTYDVHHPRMKGAYQNTTPLSERMKNWPRRYSFYDRQEDPAMKCVTLPSGKRAFVYQGDGEKLPRARFYRSTGS